MRFELGDVVYCVANPRVKMAVDARHEHHGEVVKVYCVWFDVNDCPVRQGFSPQTLRKVQ